MIAASLILSQFPTRDQPAKARYNPQMNHFRGLVSSERPPASPWQQPPTRAHLKPSPFYSQAFPLPCLPWSLPNTSDID